MCIVNRRHITVNPLSVQLGHSMYLKQLCKVPNNLYKFQPKVAICMWYNDKIRAYADLTRQLNQLYCDKYGYELIVDSKDRIPDSAKEALPKFATYACQRIPLVKEILDLKRHDYVVWIDADAAFRPGQDRTLHQILLDNLYQDVIFSADREGSINSGVLIFKNTLYTRRLLGYWDFRDTPVPHKCYTEGLRYFPTGADQGCVRHTYYDNILDLQSHSIILPMGIIQSLMRMDFPKSLIFHAAGTDTEQRVEIFQKMLDQAQSQL